MSKTIIVFDLDDTLYDELTFVQSGFRAVAAFLQKKYGISPDKSYLCMMQELRKGRGSIFNAVLRRYGRYRKKTVHACVSVYRHHTPEICLYPHAVRCLNRFKHYPLYIVTDGNKIVQGNKIKALGLNKKVKFCYITHRYGVRNAKPSPFCFLKICAREKVGPGSVIYVGDNPAKDFVGIKPHGFKTVRVMTGQHRKIDKDKKYEADFRLSDLSRLNEGFINKMMRMTP